MIQSQTKLVVDFNSNTNSLVPFWVHEQGGHSKDEEDNPTDDGDGSDRNALGDHATAEYGEAGTDPVPNDPGDHDGRNIFSGCQNYRRQLRSIAPFCQECHGEGLQEDAREQ